MTKEIIKETKNRRYLSIDKNTFELVRLTVKDEIVTTTTVIESERATIINNELVILEEI